MIPYHILGIFLTITLPCSKANLYIANINPSISQIVNNPNVTVSPNTTSTTTDKPEEIKPCEEILKKGLCSESFQRFYYNSTNKKCVEFNYTGCGGNLNNFVTQNECDVICLNATKNDDGNVSKYLDPIYLKFPLYIKYI